MNKSENNSSNKICRKCLTKDMLDKSIYNSIKEYLSIIPIEQIVSDITYNQRLEACKNCNYLHDGLCVICGCFVEARAKKNIMTCPDRKNKWLIIRDE